MQRLQNIMCKKQNNISNLTPKTAAINIAKHKENGHDIKHTAQIKQITVIERVKV